MELKPADMAGWTPQNPPAKLAAARIVLVFGQDEGGAQALGRAIVADADEVRVFDGSSLAACQGDIISALGSGSLFAAQPAVLIQGADDRGFARLEAVIAKARENDARLVIVAGDLKPASKLRKLFATDKTLVSSPVYRMRSRDIEAFARASLHELGVEASRAALAALGERLPGDRSAAMRDCEVLALYALGGGSRRVEPEDVASALDAVDEGALFAPIDHAIGGELPKALRALQSRLDAGENPIGMLRAFGRRVFQIRDLVASGLPPRAAVDAARPPIFWAEKDAMVARIMGLRAEHCDAILVGIDLAEHAIVEAAANPRHTVSRLLDTTARETMRRRSSR